MMFNEFVLPWEATRREDERYRKILKRVLLLFLLFAIVFPWLPLAHIDREEVERVPPALAKVILQQKLPPPAPVRQPEPKPVEKKKPVEKAASPAKRKRTLQAKKKVASMGVAAFSSQLASLRSSLDVAKLRARNTNVTTGAAARTTRSVLGRETARKTSGGISASSISSNGTSTQLGGRNGVAVSSPIGYGDGDGDGSGGAGSGGGKHGSSVAGGRDMESIRRVFEQHKGAIYAIYNRALRSDPEIRGKYVFHIVIEPDGSISVIKLVSSQLGDNKLEKKLLTRIRVINFGPEDVAATPVNYKFDFLPG
jgi:outer membrane biosynthesis protein TonB